MAPRPGLEPGTYGLTVEATPVFGVCKLKIRNEFSGGFRAAADLPNLCRSAMVGVSASPRKTRTGSTSYARWRRTGPERRYGELGGEGGRGEIWPAGGPSGRGMGAGRGGRQTACRRALWSRLWGTAPGAVPATEVGRVGRDCRQFSRPHLGPLAGGIERKRGIDQSYRTYESGVREKGRRLGC